jgi:hypothetical protein
MLYKARKALPTFEATVLALLADAAESSDAGGFETRGFETGGFETQP